MYGDYRLVQLLHETRLREAAERRQHNERRRLAQASTPRWRRSGPRIRARVLAWASLPFTRR
jgi:hypothetical protein